MNIWRQRDTCVVILRLVKGSIHENMLGGGGKGPWDDGGYQNKRRGKKMVFKKCKGANPEFWRKMWTIIQQNVTLKMPSYAEGWGVGMLNFWVTKRVPQKILKKAGMGHLSISNRGQFLICPPPPPIPNCFLNAPSKRWTFQLREQSTSERQKSGCARVRSVQSVRWVQIVYSGVKVVWV